MQTKQMFVVAALTMASTACSTSLTNLTDPHALAPGQLEVTLAGQGVASTVPVAESWTSAETLYARSSSDDELQLGVEDQRQLLDSALGWALFSPAADPELMLRCGLPAGPLPGLDLGLRVTPSVLKLDGKVQLLASDDARHALALQAGYGWHFGGPPDAVEWLALTDFGRDDFDLMLMWGWRQPDIVEVYLGPRAMVSRLTAERKLEAGLVDLLPQEVRRYDPSQLFREEWMVQAGATAGLKVGYRYLFARLELNTFYMWFHPVVLGQQRQYDGLVLAPSVALSGTW